jgi:hypothetical protein
LGTGSGSLRRRAAAALALAAVAGVWAGKASAATINVTTVAALQNAFSSSCTTNCAHAGDTVVLAAGTYKPTTTIDVTVGNVTITGPSTSPGAILDGSFVVPDPTSGNDAILITENVPVTLTDLTFTGAADDTPAIDANGVLTMSASTVAGNHGDGMWASGASTTITNSTISGNGTVATANAPLGGLGVLVGNPAVFQNDTITGNGDHGIGNVVLGGSGLATLRNTIVYGNGLVAHDSDCAMSVAQQDQSLDGDGSCSVALSATNPFLGALAANGGPTLTEAIPASSPAVNEGDNANCPSTDQRGVSRSDLACDIGAYEYVDTAQPTLTVPANGVSVPAVSSSGANVDYSASVNGADPDGDPVTVTCAPASGSLFQIGQTTVNCTAKDTHAKTATGSFVVTVTNSGGTACRVDGKDDGRGSTLAARAFSALLAGYQSDVCGKVTDAGGTTMALFNYDSLTGSDLGLAGVSCRSDAFGGADAPYTQSTLTKLNGAPGAIGCGALSNVTPPYAPNSGQYPSPTDTSTPVMSFPIAGTAVAIGVNLQASDCGGTRPSSIQLTTSMISRLLSGDIKTWDDSSLRAGGLNAALANCHRAVTRVVRLDAAQTTQNLKNYLVHADNNRATAIHCFTGGSWAPYANPAFNTNWPSDNGTNCSPLTPPTNSGDGPQLSLCASTPGAICYADLPAMAVQSTLIRPSVRNASDTAYAAPSTGTNANCSFAAMSLPLGAGGAVGLNTADDWATDNAAGNHGDVTFMGSAYPICELTFALVYTGLRSGGSAVSALNFDQRTTLASFFTYALEPTGQSRLLGGAFLSGLPSSILDSLRAAYQASS